MNIHYMNCGTFCPAGRLLVNGKGSPFASGRLSCLSMLVEAGDGLILVDTGLGTMDVKHPHGRIPGGIWRLLNRPVLDESETAIHQIRELGYSPMDVRHIVLTHLDFDHAGGLSDFPEAKVHVFAPEHQQAMSRPSRMDRVRYSPSQFAHLPDWVILQEEGEKWRGFGSVRALPGTPEVLLIPLARHSRGHCGVAVSTDAGWVLNAGDAYFHHAELKEDGRRCPPGLRAYENIFQYDRVQRLANLDRLREFARVAGPEIKIVCSHDPVYIDEAAKSGEETLGQNKAPGASAPGALIA